MVNVCVAVIIPDAVSWVVVKAINTTAVKVTWSLSNNTDYYRVTCDSCDMNISSSETMIVIGRLDPGTNYTVSVVACRSLCSDDVNSTKTSDTVSMMDCPSLCSDAINGTNNTCMFLGYSVCLFCFSCKSVIHRDLIISQLHYHLGVLVRDSDL